MSLWHSVGHKNIRGDAREVSDEEIIDVAFAPSLPGRVRLAIYTDPSAHAIDGQDAEIVLDVKNASMLVSRLQVAIARAIKHC